MYDTNARSTLPHLPIQEASFAKASRNMDCVSAYATLVGARSWLKKGDGWSMLAKCAAWPPSCSSVTSAVRPEPTWLGVARLVKLVWGRGKEGREGGEEVRQRPKRIEQK